MKHRGTKSDRLYRRQMASQLMLFGLYYLLTLGFAITLNAYSTVNRDRFADDFYTCVLTTGGNLNCEDLNVTFNAGIYWLLIVFVGMQGIVLFFVFGVLSERNRRLWPTLCRNLAQGRSIFDSLSATNTAITTGATAHSRRSAGFASTTTS
jgi:hypothetical protein